MRALPSSNESGEVTDDVDVVVRTNLAVPVGDQGLVHLRDVREGTLAVANDVRVPEVEVGCEVEHCAQNIALSPDLRK